MAGDINKDILRVKF